MAKPKQLTVQKIHYVLRRAGYPRNKMYRAWQRTSRGWRKPRFVTGGYMLWDDWQRVLVRHKGDNQQEMLERYQQALRAAGIACELGLHRPTGYCGPEFLSLAVALDQMV